jgi:hypothetical protein
MRALREALFVRGLLAGTTLAAMVAILEAGKKWV